MCGFLISHDCMNMYYYVNICPLRTLLYGNKRYSILYITIFQIILFLSIVYECPMMAKNTNYLRTAIRFNGFTHFNETATWLKGVSADNFHYDCLRRVWRHQRANQNLYIKEEQTTQWSKEKVQKDKQRSTKHANKTKDRVTRTPRTINRGWMQVLRNGKQFLSFLYLTKSIKFNLKLNKVGWI